MASAGLRIMYLVLVMWCVRQCGIRSTLSKTSVSTCCWGVTILAITRSAFTGRTHWQPQTSKIYRAGLVSCAVPMGRPPNASIGQQGDGDHR